MRLLLPRLVAALLTLTLLTILAPQHASAAELREDRDSYVRKGFFVTAEYGAYIYALQPSKLTTEGGPQASTLGSILGVELGYDVAESVSLQFTFWAANVSGNVQLGGGNMSLLFSLGANIHFVRSQQLHVYAKIGAGMSVVIPGDLLSPGLMVHAGLGLRWYTRLRHFSVGIEALGLLQPPITSDELTLGIGVMPNIMYTF